jgi:hypothetical protein
MVFTISYSFLVRLANTVHAVNCGIQSQRRKELNWVGRIGYAHLESRVLMSRVEFEIVKLAAFVCVG